MHPINKAERRNAFVNFLLLFIVTVALITTIIFFSMEVPLAENKRLREEISQMEKEREMAKAFQRSIAEIKEKLTDPGYLKNPPYLVRRRIQGRINSLDTLMNQLPHSDASIYPSVIEVLHSWNDAVVNSQVRQPVEPLNTADNQ
ncbi:MAG TPA: type VI secretion system TssO [Flavisolibacter sp.]|nr:type VI secretion system TssO [Flavisolibacter sp.]